MAYYAYKTVRDLLPQHIIDKQGPNYEGDGNYDGDQWYAAEDYILELIKQRDDALSQLAECKEDAERYRWLLGNYLIFNICDQARHHGNLESAIDAARSGKE